MFKPDKSTIHTRPVEYNTNIHLQIDNHNTMHEHAPPKLIGVTLDPNLTYRTHIANI